MFLFSTTERPDAVQSALRHASSSTGVDFDYLLATAKRESNLDPQAKASTSSATGLFQFIESTWFAILKEAGSRHGYEQAASRIERTDQGGYRIQDQGLRDEILALRRDPTAAALMAGELTRQNAATLEGALGRPPSPGELYIAHFLGAGGAAELTRLARNDPETPAASHFGAAARANPTIFYTPEGLPRAAREVYATLARLPAGGEVAPSPSQHLSAYAPTGDRAGPVFHGLFNDGPARQGLSSMGRAVGPFWSGLFTTPGEAGAGHREADARAARAPAALWSDDRRTDQGLAATNRSATAPHLWRDPSQP